MLVVGFLPKENSPSLNPGDPCGTDESIRSRVGRIGKSFVERHKLVATLSKRSSSSSERFGVDFVVVHEKTWGISRPNSFLEASSK